MTADHHVDDLSELALGDRFLGIGHFGVEALRIADREFDVLLAGNGDQFIGFPELQRDRFFEQDVLARLEAIARDRIVRTLRCGRDVDDLDLGIGDDVLVVERGGDGVGQCLYFGETLGLDFADMQAVYQGGFGERFRPDATAPTGANNCNFDLSHEGCPVSEKWMHNCRLSGHK